MEKLKGTEVTMGTRVAGVLTGDWYCDCGRKDRSVEPPCQGSQAGGSWEVPAPGLGGPAGIAPSTGTLPGPVPEPSARHLHQRGDGNTAGCPGEGTAALLLGQPQLS